MDDVRIAIEQVLEDDSTKHQQEYDDSKRAYLYAVVGVNPDGDGRTVEINHGVHGEYALMIMGIARLLITLKSEIGVSSGEILGNLIDKMASMEEHDRKE